MKKNCVVCDSEFEAKGSNRTRQKYCTPKCSDSFWIKKSCEKSAERVKIRLIKSPPLYCKSCNEEIIRTTKTYKKEL